MGPSERLAVRRGRPEHLSEPHAATPFSYPTGLERVPSATVPSVVFHDLIKPATETLSLVISMGMTPTAENPVSPCGWERKLGRIVDAPRSSGPRPRVEAIEP